MSIHIRGRDSNLDLVRSIAFLLVLAVHFLLNTGFYDTPSVGGRMLFGEIYRSFCLCCVPLFVVLSGYLLGEKVLSWKYYKGVLRILVTYLLASLACMAYQVGVQGVSLTAGWVVTQLAFFRGAPYSWYVEMYLGLFLLIPFLNGMYKSLDTKKKKLALLVTLLLLSALPTILCAHPMPDRWLNLWPVTYYIMGSYLREYPLRLPVWGMGTLFLIVAAADGVLWYRLNGGLPHVWHPISDWGGFGVAVATLLLFSLLRRVRTDLAPRWVQRGLGEISRLSFAAYLLSWIPDQVIYGFLNRAVPFMPDRFVYIPLTVGAAVLFSLILAWFVEWAVQKILVPLNRIGRSAPAIEPEKSIK